MSNIGIIIPYRDRAEHLKTYIAKCKPIFDKIIPKHIIIIVEQDDDKPFNRGKLINCGIHLIQKECSHFITQDVDLLPSEFIVDKYYSNKYINDPILPIYCAHRLSLGGICKLQKQTVILLNGFPNYIWGWGVEDRALLYRSIYRNIPIKNKCVIYSDPKCDTLRKQFSVLPHKSNARKYDKGDIKTINDNENNIAKSKNKDKQIQHLLSSGLNTLQYTINQIKRINNTIVHFKVKL